LKYGGLALGLALLAAGLLSGAAPPVRKAQPLVALPAPPAHLDYVFLASDRPVLIRLHLQVGGRPYYAAWNDYMTKWFNHFDRNGDGWLSKEEVQGRVPNNNYLSSHLQGSIGNNLRGQLVPFEALDTNKDGKVSLAEFADYYRRSGFGPLRFSSFSNDATTNGINDTLYKYLDTNKDGKLSKEELARGPELLRKLDVDEDEVWSAEELTPERDARGRYRTEVAEAIGAYKGAMAVRGPGVLEVRPGADLAGLARQVVAHYAKGKDGKLSKAEVQFDAKLFAELDTNKDGKLDVAELKRFFTRPADLELVGRMGNLQGPGGLLSRIGLNTSLRPKRAEVFNPKRRPMPLAAAVKQVDDNTVAFALGDARIELQGNEVSGFNRFRNVRNFYEREFNNLDPKGRGYVELSQEKESQGRPFLFQIFPMADRDGDGKLTRKELKAYLDLQAEGSNCYATVQVSDQGRSLFNLIDGDQDGRLSVREFRTAWERVGPLARSAAGVAREDVPRRIQVTLGQSNAFFRRPAAFGGPPEMRRARKGPGPVPAWFTKMDRNGDGDVSRREFLGTEEEFRMLDLDGDGLISADEARAYEAKRKKAGADKR
jgi:Ca2+-binding EF-hand superfamily protein